MHLQLGGAKRALAAAEAEFPKKISNPLLAEPVLYIMHYKMVMAEHLRTGHLIRGYIMARKFLTAFIGITALAFGAAAATSAEAQSKKKKDGKVRTLTIQKRSFLDNGKHPLPGETRRYVIMHSELATPVYRHQSDLYGGSILPGPYGPFGPK